MESTFLLLGSILTKNFIHFCENNSANSSTMSSRVYKYEEFLGKQDLDGCRFWPFFFCGHHIERVSF